MSEGPAPAADHAPVAVLVASADAGTRAQVALTLGPDRYRVVEVDDTEPAVRVIASDRPSLLVLDAQLPGAGALAIARSVRSQPETSAARVLVLVRRDGATLDDAPGVDATLALPFTAFALLGKVEGLLADRPD